MFETDATREVTPDAVQDVTAAFAGDARQPPASPSRRRRGGRMMEAALVAFLAPFLPHLVETGTRIGTDAAERFGAEAWEHAKRIWQRLGPRVEEKPAASEAARDVADRPDDDDAVAALRLQLRKVLADDPALADDVRRLWKEAEAANVTEVTVTASGERSVALGGGMSGGQINTGDTRRPADDGPEA
jgi:hypothetical protein